MNQEDVFVKNFAFIDDANTMRPSLAQGIHQKAVCVQVARFFFKLNSFRIQAAQSPTFHNL